MSNIQAEANGEAEVFVLSPDLLQKLGINLCNIAPTALQSNTCKRKKNKHCLKNVPDSNDELLYDNVSKLQDSSILETASLMKNSVFLSPSFVPVVGDAIPGEVEIANKIEHLVDLYTTERNTEVNDKDNNNHFIQENVIIESVQDLQNDSSFKYKQPTKSRILNETEPVTCNGNGRYDVPSQAAIKYCNEINMNKTLDDVKSMKCLKACVPTLDVPTSSGEQVPHTYNNFSKESENQVTIPTLDSIKCKVDTEKSLLIPVSKERDEKHTLDLDGVADNFSNIIDNHQLCTNQIMPKKNGQLFVTPDQSMVDICNAVNIDIIKYANSDKSVNLELDNILHENEIFTPMLSSASSTNVISNETDVIGNEKEITIPRYTSPSQERGQHNIVKENDILIPLSPDLINISNISRDTQDINIDILYEPLEHDTDNENEIINMNLKQTYDSEQDHQCNGVDILNDIESDKTSDKELDTEILISMSSNLSNASTYKEEKIKFNEKHELRTEEELIGFLHGNNIMSTILESDNLVMTKNTNINSTFVLDVTQVIKAKSSDIIINHNGSIKKIVNNDGEKRTQRKTIDSVSSHHQIDANVLDSCKNSNIIMNDQSTELNIIEQNITKETDDVIDQNYSINDIDTKKINLDILSNEGSSHSCEHRPERNISINYTQSENNNIYQESNELILSNQYKKQDQNTDLLNGVDNNVEVFRNNNSNMESANENEIKVIAQYLKEAFQKKRLFRPKIGIHPKSKIFIQGVEKPGGSDEHEIAFKKFKLDKKYEKKKNLQLHVASSFKGISFETSKNPKEISTEINTCIEPSLFIKRQEFCLCGDFGKLSLDDYNNLYEHIHFGSNTSINCPVDILFEIYNERTSLTPYEFREYAREEDIYRECDSGHICWQKIEYQEETNVSTKVILNEKVVTANKVFLETDTSLKKSNSETETPQEDRESVSISNPKEVKGTVENSCSDVIDEINANSLTELIITDENTVAFQSDIVSNKITENNTLLDSQCTENMHQNEVENIKVMTKNFSENEAIMNSTTANPEIAKLEDKVNNRKRKIKTDLEEPRAKKNLKEDVKCAVCKQMFTEADWEGHISKVHYYIAWKIGETIDFENLLLLKKLKQKLKTKGSLICTFCGFEFVKLTNFLNHVKKCFSKKASKYNIDSKEVTSTSKSKLSTCGVCRLEIRDTKWIEHISEKHQYLAWKDGESPLDISDENKVKDHLLKLVKNQGHLICVKCGLLRKYTAKTIKNFLLHINKCNVNNTNESRTSRVSEEKSREKEELNEKAVNKSSSVCKCAVCEKDVDISNWLDHIFEQHNYLAWKSGEEALNFEDQTVLRQHLNDISKSGGGLKCSKCGIIRKYVKTYLQHIKFCDLQNETVGDNVTNNEKKTHGEDDISNNSRKRPRRTYSINNEDVISSSKDDLSLNIENSTDNTPNRLSTDTPDEGNGKDSPKGTTTCGVCKMVVEESSWIDHIGKEHNYIAWKSEDTPLDPENDHALWQPLYDIVTSAGKLVCSKCGIERKYPKSFLNHIRTCTGPAEDTSFDNNLDISRAETAELKCGVCQELMARDGWISHIQKAHNYIAWIDGQNPLDTNKKDEILEHLKKLVDEVGELICVRCGTTRKYAKPFLHHLDQCTGENDQKYKCKIGSSADEMATCGVCNKGVRINQWLRHIREKHNYVAWKTDQTPVNIQKPAQVEKRLRALVDKIKELVCPKCGYKSSDAQMYVQHSKNCTGNPDYVKNINEVTDLEQKELYQCALCEDKIKYGSWKKHAVEKHYTVTWVDGDEPIDLHNPNLITKILKDYLKYGKLVCKVCGTSRSSGIGFFAHFVSCGLTEEESDKFKMTCTICDSKILGIYKYQHMGHHTQQEQVRERQQKAQELRNEERTQEHTGPRRAAEKARMVIEETVRQYKHVCKTCAFATDVKEEMTEHRCPKRRKTSEDVDITIEDQQETTDDEEDLVDEAEESDDSVEEKIEEDEEDLTFGKRRRHHESHNLSSRITRIPFTVTKLDEYLAKYVKDYTAHYFTTETLFPQWTQCKYEMVQDKEILETLPPMEESCQVYSNQNWQNYQRWQAVTDKEKTTLFAGYSIRQLSWLPAHLDVSSHHDHNVLAVACHPGDDVPQINREDLPEYNTLVQIWDFKDFKSDPKMSLGLVLPFGSVWAMDWCPSGARECLVNDDQGFVRMGLLAVACSNGMAYILPVPYPSTVVTSDSTFCKLEPVAKLKFSIKTDRPKYQATSICWSKQKGHSTVVVGYSDGTTAYYDLNTESPFLKAKENNVTVFYPYFDERLLNGCVSSVSSFPIAGGSGLALGAASPAGCALVPAAGTRCVSSRSHLAAASAMFLPGWPSVMLAGEEVITSTMPNELEYWGFGRRAGPAQATCGCEHCGLVVSYMPPFLRHMRPHHARSELNKTAIVWIGSKKLGKKRKHNEDKKDTAAESFTYKEAVAKYGIQFQYLKSKNTPEYKASITHHKEIDPERFPLAVVTSMAFCSSARHHKRLAVATHSGLMFVFNV